MLSMYDIMVGYEGRKVVLHCDNDKIVFINHNGITLENGQPLTAEEIVGFLTAFGHHDVTHIAGVTTDGIGFFDGQERYYSGYGLNIEFDENGDPKYKIEDGKVLSSRVLCDCEEDYGGRGPVRCGSEDDYKAFRERLISSGKFTLLPSEFKMGDSKCYQYKCNKCGTEWLLPKFYRKAESGYYSLQKKAYYEKWLDQQYGDKKIRSKRRITVAILTLIVILLIAFFIWFTSVIG